MVFTIFFSRLFYYYFTTNKIGQISKKKVLISEVANKNVLVFCMRPNKDTTYIPHFDQFSIL